MHLNLDSGIPKHQVIVSKRARHMRIQISHRKGVVLVIPQKQSYAKALQFMASKRRWIEKHLARLAKLPPPQSNQQSELPATIELKALEQLWQVEYSATLKARSIKISSTDDNRLILTGATSNKMLCHKALRRWLQLKGREHLIPLAKQISNEVGLSYNHLSIGFANTRWGWCNTKGTIRLNSKLLLVEPELVRYVIVHELCHTVHHNHGKKFWQLVTKLDPEWKIHRNRLKNHEHSGSSLI